MSARKRDWQLRQDSKGSSTTHETCTFHQGSCYEQKKNRFEQKGTHNEHKEGSYCAGKVGILRDPEKGAPFLFFWAGFVKRGRLREDYGPLEFR